jgi:hypothetical protein
MEVLTQVTPTSDRSADEVLQALARLSENYNKALNPSDVAQCLLNIGNRLFAETQSDERSLQMIAKWFPQQVYEHVRTLHKRTEDNPEGRHARGFPGTLSLGPIQDAKYVEDEISNLWQEASTSHSTGFACSYRLALIRSLLWSNPQLAEKRILILVAGCRNSKEVNLIAELVSIPGSHFVFDFPDLVRTILKRSDDFQETQSVQRKLWQSACGGGRSWTEHELNPEYRYILEQGEALANRYTDDGILGRFYRSIAESERQQLEWHRRQFANQDGD